MPTAIWVETRSARHLKRVTDSPPPMGEPLGELPRSCNRRRSRSAAAASRHRLRGQLSMPADAGRRGVWPKSIHVLPTQQPERMRDDAVMPLRYVRDTVW